MDTQQNSIPEQNTFGTPPNIPTNVGIVPPIQTTPPPSANSSSQGPRFSRKNKILGVLGLVVALIAIPLTIIYVQQQQDTRSRAEATTELAFSPDKVEASSGAEFTIKALVTPNKNLVSAIDAYFTYDPAKLEFVSVSPNITKFKDVLHNTTDENAGVINLALNIGNDPSNVIQGQSPTEFATLTFRAKGNASGSALIAFSPGKTRIFSLRGGDSTDCDPTTTDCPGENVFLSSSVAQVMLNGIGGISATPSVTLAPTATASPTLTPAVCPVPSKAKNVEIVCPGCP